MPAIYGFTRRRSAFHLVEIAHRPVRRDWPRRWRLRGGRGARAGFTMAARANGICDFINIDGCRRLVGVVAVCCGWRALVPSRICCGHRLRTVSGALQPVSVAETTVSSSPDGSDAEQRWSSEGRPHPGCRAPPCEVSQAGGASTGPADTRFAPVDRTSLNWTAARPSLAVRGRLSVIFGVGAPVGGDPREWRLLD